MKIENFFLDDEHNYVTPRDAKWVVQTKTDDDGNLMSEKWFVPHIEPQIGNIYYMNDEHSIVDKDEATIMVRSISDSEGNIVSERWFNITSENPQ